MTLVSMSPQASERFDRLCKVVGAKGKGITLHQLGAARALALELEAGDPDPEKVELYRKRLGIEPEEVGE